MLGIRFPEDKPSGYDPELDLQEVDQFGFVNLCEAYERGIVPGSLEVSEDMFNGVDDPASLMPRSKDVFDSIRQAEYVRLSLDGFSKSEREKHEKAVEYSTSVAGAPSE